MWVVAVPGLTYLQAAVLLSDNPSQVSSWESHYLEVRTRFFGVAMARALHSALLPWVAGAYAWLTPAPVHIGAVANLFVAVVGLSTASLRVHLALGLMMLVITVLFLFLTPSRIGAAA